MASITAAALQQLGLDGFRRLAADAGAVLDDRNVLVHSVTFEVVGEDLPTPRTEIWHARSGTTAEQPNATAIAEHAFDIRRCFKRAARLLPEAGRRYQALGAVSGVQRPSPLSWQSP